MTAKKTTTKKEAADPAPPGKDANLWQRLLWVQGQARRLQRDIELEVGGGRKVPAISHDEIVAAVSNLMVAAGVYARFELARFYYEPVKTSTGKTTQWHVVEGTATFINVDKPDERDERHFRGTGLDNSDKGIGKALSYGKKYLLRDAFLLNAGGEDPDAGKSAELGDAPPEPRRRSQASNGPPRRQAAQSGPDQPPGVDIRPIPVTENIPPEAWSEIIAAWHSGRRISPPQQKRLYAIAHKEGGWKDAQVKEALVHHLGLGSTADIPNNPGGRGDESGPYGLLCALFEAYSPAEVGPEDENQDPDQDSLV